MSKDLGLSKAVVCDYCAHACRLGPGQIGICGVRQNRDGQIESMFFSKIAAFGIDPVEKKPLYHFYPGEGVISLASFGCNLACSFCQNYRIAQEFSASLAKEMDALAPELMPKIMQKENLRLVAYTYGEPTVWQDFMLECCEHVSANSGKNIMITNGFFSKKALDKFANAIDAFNIDLKGSDEFYRALCGARLSPVLNSISHLVGLGKHVEVTTLLIEDVHSLEDVRDLAKMLSDCGVKIWHISRFYPAYKMLDNNPTSEEFLQEALDIANEYNIDYIYGGNTRSFSVSTKCSKCKSTIIERNLYQTRILNSSIQDEKLICDICKNEVIGCF